MSGKIILFDKEIPVREDTCYANGEKVAGKVQPFVNIYIRFSDACQANCKFCEYHNQDSFHFNKDKFIWIINEIKKQGVYINKFNFTGGEPMLYPDLVDELSNYICDNFSSQTVLNTNGINFNKIKNFDDCLSSVSLSRHHYDDEKNFAIFGTENLASRKEIMTNSFNNVMHLRCNLIKNQIDSQKEVLNYIESFSKKIYYYGFVSLMKINNFCKENFIDYQELDLDNLPNSRVCYYRTRKADDKKICECKNIAHYTNSGELVKLYSRTNYIDENYENMLVYDRDTLKLGFSDTVII